MDQLEKMGFEVVGIAPDAPDKLATMAERAKISFRLLSDTDFAAARGFGVAFKREGKRALPVPSVFVTAPNGTIQYVYVNPNYRERLDPAVLVAMARDVANRFKMSQ